MASSVGTNGRSSAKRNTSRARARIGRQGSARARFRQQEPGSHEVAQRQPGGKEGRSRVAPVAEKSTNRRPEYKAQTKGRAHEAHATRPVLRRGRIGDVRLGGWNVRAGNAGGYPRREEERQRAREAEDRIGHERPEQPDEQDGAPAESIGHAPPHGREEELHQRERAGEQADGERGGPERLGIEREQGDDDAEAEQIDEDGDENDDARRHVVSVLQVRGPSWLRVMNTACQTPWPRPTSSLRTNAVC